MKVNFGLTGAGEMASLYTLKIGNITAKVTDFGATLVSLLVPDANGNVADVVLGYDDCRGYETGTSFLGTTVGRNANRIGGAAFEIGSTKVQLTPNENANNLHSGPDCYHLRLWEVEEVSESSITMRLDSPHMDQGFPGNAVVKVTYALEAPATLRIQYDGISDRDTVFNLTNHTYFNLAGHDRAELAMDQTLCLPARIFTPNDAEGIPTGELRSVEGTPMDFREPKALGRDIGEDYEPLHLQGGYDHNFEVFCQPCATLHDPSSGRTMVVTTDCPGIQLYTANFTRENGKEGIRYEPRCGVCLETQYYPDSVHHSDWAQSIVKAGQPYHSVTRYSFV